MKWVMILAIICYLDAPVWMGALWAVCFMVDAAIWFVRCCG